MTRHPSLNPLAACALLCLSLPVLAEDTAPPLAPVLTDAGLLVELKARQVEPAFTGDGQGVFNGVLRPYWLRQVGDNDITAVTAKLYASNEYDADTDVNATRETDQAYAEITELWYQHIFEADSRQAMRLGVQKINDGYSQWWNTELAGGGYFYSSSLVNGYVAAGSRASWLRTDWDVTDPRAEHGWVVAAQASRQWRLDHFVALRSLVRLDTDPGYATGETLDRADFEREPTEAVWLAGELRGEFHQTRSLDYARYVAELGVATGSAVRYSSGRVADPDALQIRGAQDRDIEGVMLRLEGQYVWERDWRWRLGGGASIATGGDGGSDAGYVGTGITPYRDELFGTEARGHANGEAMRLEPGNATIVNLHAAVSPQRGHDLLLVLRSAWRTEAAGEIVLGGTTLPGGAGAGIGDSVDLVYSWRLRPFFRERTVRTGGFEGAHLIVTASHFEPAFADPGKDVLGDVFSLEYFRSF